MDEFPGMMFEPMSLHKYLYCEGNPLNAIDPSGMRTLKEIIISNHLYSWLCTTIINVLFSSLAFLISKKNDAEWNGWMTNISASFGKSFGITVGLAIYHGVRDTGKGLVRGWGMWLVIVFGHHSSYFNRSGKKIDFSWSVFTPSWFKSPGLIGLKKIALSGLVSWSNVGFNLPKIPILPKLKFIGLSATAVFMGWGVNISKGIVIGQSRGINLSLMGGFSSPLGFWGGE